MLEHGMVAPVLALIGWTFVMWVWMYATRIPAMQKIELDMAELSRTGAPLVLPPEVARVADVRFAVFALASLLLLLLLARTVASLS